MSIKKYFGSRRFKYGSVAVVFSVIFVAAVLVLNIILTFIGKEKSLYADLTKEEFYTVSDASIQQLEDIKEPVEIVFFQKKEDIGEPNGSNPLGYVKYLAEEYAKSFDFVSVKYVDMLGSPALANSYKSSTNDNIKTTSVVITCPTTAKKKIVQTNGFFTFNEDGSVYGFNGEKRITSCILQVANTDKPTAYFTTGHNEYLSGSFATLLDEQGYEVGILDLSTQDIPADTDLVIINQPAIDLSGMAAQNAGGTNEIDKIKNYIQQDYGDVILVLSAAYPDLPELRELMEENFGITYIAENVLNDTTANTVGNNGAMIIAHPAGTDTTFEYQMHKAVTEKNIKILAPYSVPLKIIGNPDKYTAAVLQSSATSQFLSVNEEQSLSVDAPNVPLVAVSSKISYDSDQNEKRGNLLVVGSMYLFENDMTGNSSYGNADFLYGVLKSFGNTSVSLDISTKPFRDDYLDILKKDANAATLVITLVIPVILLVFGMIIWVRRKRK
ncbi:MAG: hypothetical protein E7583_02600 [Ruminococcaceae bacterium]|nr:hypothetical protein [Oscillospiraceae bacterium]